MKKVSYLELSTIIITILITFHAGINLNIIKHNSGVNSWITIILSYIFGLIPLLLTIYISSYKEELNLYEKNKKLFGNILGTIINTILSLILFIIAITILYNITSFINTQFLYHTPIIISATLLVLLVIYCVNQEITVISHTSIILTLINIIIFFTSIFSITRNIQLDNLLPIMKIDTKNIIIPAIKLSIINTLPLITILAIPKDKITNKKKYNKALIISYIISAIMSLIMTISTISILGIYLVDIFEFPEYMVLKKIKLFGFLERIENIVSIKWITETYIYLTFLVYNISKSFTKKEKHLKVSNITIGILLIISSNYLFKNITTFTTFTKSILIYIISFILIIYLIIAIKLFTNKHKFRNT